MDHGTHRLTDTLHSSSLLRSLLGIAEQKVSWRLKLYLGLLLLCASSWGLERRSRRHSIENFHQIARHTRVLRARRVLPLLLSSSLRRRNIRPIAVLYGTLNANGSSLFKNGSHGRVGLSFLRCARRHHVESLTRETKKRRSR